MTDEKIIDYQEHIVRCNKLIELELNNWDKIGASPSNVVVDTFIMDAYINALASFLVEKGIIEDEEFTFHFKKHLLDNLINARTQLVEPAIKEETRKRITNGLPRMDLPKQ